MPKGAPAGDESKGTVENKSTVEKKDRTEFWLDVGKAVGMPLAALILGFVFNYSLSKSQARDSDMRLYTEMMGRREQADSDLRKDMFKAVLDKFMSNNEKMKGPEKLDQQILELELLAYNFHESLDIGPLFKNLHREILSLNGPNREEIGSAPAEPSRDVEDGTELGNHTEWSVLAPTTRRRPTQRLTLGRTSSCRRSTLLKAM